MLSLYRHSAVPGRLRIDLHASFLLQSMSSASPASSAPTVRSDVKLIGLVGLAHAVSHFSQLLLAPRFPWLKDAFHVSYTELGAVLTVFFVVSSLWQPAPGSTVDRPGPRPVLFAGLGILGPAASGYALPQTYWSRLGS